jgi:hypothetical protein
MRKIRWVDVSDVDTQKCLLAFNDRSHELGIKEEDVISVQYVWNDNPAGIYTGTSRTEKANVTLFIFYWEPEQEK